MTLTPLDKVKKAKKMELYFQFMFDTRCHPQVSSYLLGRPPKDFKEHSKYLYDVLSKEVTRYFILENDQQDPVAYSSITETSPYMCELGFAVSPEYQGQGIGVDLVTLTVAEALKTYKFVTLKVKEDNVRAIKLYSKMNFTEITNDKGITVMALQ